MTWQFTSTRIELGRLFLLDWSTGILLQVPFIGFGVWTGKFTNDGSWQVVVD
jgi:hypothetical protein